MILDLFTYQAEGSKVHQTRRAKLEKTKSISVAEREEYVESERGTERTKQLQRKWHQKVNDLI